MEEKIAAAGLCDKTIFKYHYIFYTCETLQQSLMLHLELKVERVSGVWSVFLPSSVVFFLSSQRK